MKLWNNQDTFYLLHRSKHHLSQTCVMNQFQDNTNIWFMISDVCILLHRDLFCCCAYFLTTNWSINITKKKQHLKHCCWILGPKWTGHTTWLIPRSILKWHNWCVAARKKALTADMRRIEKPPRGFLWISWWRKISFRSISIHHWQKMHLAGNKSRSKHNETPGEHVAETKISSSPPVAVIN